ncbi:hypothetical protein HALLA_04320 (plasmid) [Halostagnicola larsenii XH-48]|uniref:Uncharacterized protein n=1 Tax=Halostagnicola larsenii XH-48 TaxID=797299 RepID=W0JSH0_9EURY|nr:hypothetical protein HALLA_04320 [Halostagnicola larsenii XH-48]
MGRSCSVIRNLFLYLWLLLVIRRTSLPTTGSVESIVSVVLVRTDPESALFE